MDEVRSLSLRRRARVCACLSEVPACNPQVEAATMLHRAIDWLEHAPALRCGSQALLHRRWSATDQTLGAAAASTRFGCSRCSLEVCPDAWLLLLSHARATDGCAAQLICLSTQTPGRLCASSAVGFARCAPRAAPMQHGPTPLMRFHASTCCWPQLASSSAQRAAPPTREMPGCARVLLCSRVIQQSRRALLMPAACVERRQAHDADVARGFASISAALLTA